MPIHHSLRGNSQSPANSMVDFCWLSPQLLSSFLDSRTSPHGDPMLVYGLRNVLYPDSPMVDAT